MKEQGGKVEMPVAMAIMLANREGAIGAFEGLDEARRDEYLRRASEQTTVEGLRSVVEDIVKIG